MSKKQSKPKNASDLVAEAWCEAMKLRGEFDLLKRVVDQPLSIFGTEGLKQSVESLERKVNALFDYLKVSAQWQSGTPGRLVATKRGKSRSYPWSFR